jgi:hypothetical protein
MKRARSTTTGRLLQLARGSYPLKRGRTTGKNHKSVTIANPAKMVANNRPEYIKTTLRYADFYVVDPGTSAGVHIYRANSLYDCDVSIGGLQPVGFDQYMGLYQKFTVTKARIKVVFTNTVLTTPTWTANVVGVSLNTSGSAGTEADLYIANGDCNWSVMGRDYASKTLTMEIDVAKYFATDIWNDDVFSGDVSQDCARQCYFHVFSQGDADLGQVHYMVEIEYDVAFRGLKSAAFS